MFKKISSISRIEGIDVLDVKNFAHELQHKTKLETDANVIASTQASYVNTAFNKENTATLDKEKNLDLKQLHNIWDLLLSYIKDKYGESAYNNWFKNLQFAGIKNGVLSIFAPTKFIRELIVKNYLESMLRYIKHIDSQLDRIEIKSNFNSSKKLFTVGVEREIGIISLTEQELDISTVGGQGCKSKHKAFNIDDNKDNQTVNRKIFTDEIALNNNFLFKNFVCGQSNSIAYGAAKQIAELSCLEYNDTNKILHSNINGFRSLYIHSSAGMGKTHLLQSIAHYIMQNNEKLNVAYLTAERFTQQYILSVKKNALTEFKHLLSELDILIIDDLQLICGRNSTEKEFVNIFDCLLECNNKKIVLAADSAPYSLNFTQRTKSRLAGCMVVGMDKPDYGLRLKILQNKSQETGVNLSDELLMMIAENIDVSIRELEAMLYKIITHCHLLGVDVNHNIVSRLIEEYIKDTNSINLLSEIKNNSHRAELSRYTRKSHMHKRATRTQQYPKQNKYAAFRDSNKENINSCGEDLYAINDNNSNEINQQNYRYNGAAHDNKLFEIILQDIIEVFNVSKEDLLSKSRVGKLLVARQILAFLSRDVLRMHHAEIGRKLGGRNYSTIIYFINTLFKTLDKDKTGHLHNIFHSLKTKLSKMKKDSYVE